MLFPLRSAPSVRAAGRLLGMYSSSTSSPAIRGNPQALMMMGFLPGEHELSIGAGVGGSLVAVGDETIEKGHRPAITDESYLMYNGGAGGVVSHPGWTRRPGPASAESTSAITGIEIPPPPDCTPPATPVLHDGIEYAAGRARTPSPSRGLSPWHPTKTNSQPGFPSQHSVNGRTGHPLDQHYFNIENNPLLVETGLDTYMPSTLQTGELPLPPPLTPRREYLEPAPPPRRLKTPADITSRAEELENAPAHIKAKAAALLAESAAVDSHAAFQQKMRALPASIQADRLRSPVRAARSVFDEGSNGLLPPGTPTNMLRHLPPSPKAVPLVKSDEGDVETAMPDYTGTPDEWEKYLNVRKDDSTLKAAKEGFVAEDDIDAHLNALKTRLRESSKAASPLMPEKSLHKLDVDAYSRFQSLAGEELVVQDTMTVRKPLPPAPVKETKEEPPVREATPPLLVCATAPGRHQASVPDPNMDMPIFEQQIPVQTTPLANMLPEQLQASAQPASQEFWQDEPRPDYSTWPRHEPTRLVELPSMIPPQTPPAASVPEKPERFSDVLRAAQQDGTVEEVLRARFGAMLHDRASCEQSNSGGGQGTVDRVKKTHNPIVWKDWENPNVRDNPDSFGMVDDATEKSTYSLHAKYKEIELKAKVDRVEAKQQTSTDVPATAAFLGTQNADRKIVTHSNSGDLDTLIAAFLKQQDASANVEDSVPVPPKINPPPFRHAASEHGGGEMSAFKHIMGLRPAKPREQVANMRPTISSGPYTTFPAPPPKQPEEHHKHGDASPNTNETETPPKDILEKEYLRLQEKAKGELSSDINRTARADSLRGFMVRPTQRKSDGSDRPRVVYSGVARNCKVRLGGSADVDAIRAKAASMLKERCGDDLLFRAGDSDENDIATSAPVERTFLSDLRKAREMRHADLMSHRPILLDRAPGVARPVLAPKASFARQPPLAQHRPAPSLPHRGRGGVSGKKTIRAFDFSRR